MDEISRDIRKPTMLSKYCGALCNDEEPRRAFNVRVDTGVISVDCKAAYASVKIVHHGRQQGSPVTSVVSLSTSGHLLIIARALT